MTISRLLRQPFFCGAALLLAFAGVTVACDEEVTSTPPVGAPATTTDAGGTKPLYALGSLVISPGSNTQTTYMVLLDSFDSQPKVTLAGGREFAGYAPAAAIGGKVVMTDGESPKLTRFAIGDDKSWTEDASLNLNSYSTTPLTASIVVSDTLAYVPFDAVSYVAINPATFALGAELLDPTTVPLKRGELNVVRGYSRPTVGKYSFQPFYWADPLFTTLSSVSQVGVIDNTTNTWVAAPEVQCPHLHISTTDDEGNVYFSPGQYSIASAVLDTTFPRNCMVRIKAGETTLDPTFDVKFNALAEGREGSNFFYIGNGLGFFNAYHAELDTPGTDPSKIIYSSKYHLWTLDLKTMTAKMTDGIDFGGGQYVAFKIGTRVFVAQPAGDYASTAVYEILASGAAEKRFDVEGWAFNMFQVR